MIRTVSTDHRFCDLPVIYLCSDSQSVFLSLSLSLCSMFTLSSYVESIAEIELNYSMNILSPINQRWVNHAINVLSSLSWSHKSTCRKLNESYYTVTSQTRLRNFDELDDECDSVTSRLDNDVHAVQHDTTV